MLEIQNGVVQLGRKKDSIEGIGSFPFSIILYFMSSLPLLH